jgi:hypothetical protein
VSISKSTSSSAESVCRERARAAVGWFACFCLLRLRGGPINLMLILKIATLSDGFFFRRILLTAAPSARER